MSQFLSHYKQYLSLRISPGSWQMSPMNPRLHRVEWETIINRNAYISESAYCNRLSPNVTHTNQEQSEMHSSHPCSYGHGKRPPVNGRESQLICIKISLMNSRFWQHWWYIYCDKPAFFQTRWRYSLSIIQQFFSPRGQKYESGSCWHICCDHRRHTDRQETTMAEQIISDFNIENTCRSYGAGLETSGWMEMRNIYIGRPVGWQIVTDFSRVVVVVNIYWQLTQRGANYLCSPSRDRSLHLVIF